MHMVDDYEEAGGSFHLNSGHRASLVNLVAEDDPTERIAADISQLTELVQDRAGWNVVREKLAQLTESTTFDIILFVLIALNFVLVIKETDDGAICASVPDRDCTTDASLVYGNIILLTVFVLECFVKIYIYRAMFWSNSWNIFDFVLIACGVISEFLAMLYPALSLIRLVRLCRLGRMLHIMVDNFKPLYMIVMGFCAAIMSLFWALFFLMLASTAWSVMLVILVHPIAVDIVMSDSGAYDACDRCSTAFSSVMNANLTLLQTVIMADGWGEVCIPLINHSPWVGLIFCGIIATMDLCICNLILATIVHSAEEARHEDCKFVARTKKALDAQQRKRLIELCEQLDTDQSGTLSEEELLDGYSYHPGFQAIFLRLGLTVDDVKSVLGLADADGSGDVDYMEFIDTIMLMRSTDPKVMLMLVKHDITDVRAKLQDALTILGARDPLRPLSRGITPGAQVLAASEGKDTKQISTNAAILPLPESSCKTDTSPTSQQETSNAPVYESIRFTTDVWEPVPPSMPKTPIEFGPMLESGEGPSHNEHVLPSSPSPSMAPIELGAMLWPGAANLSHNERCLYNLRPPPPCKIHELNVCTCQSI